MTIVAGQFMLLSANRTNNAKKNSTVIPVMSKKAPSFLSFLRLELPLWVSITTTALFLVFGNRWLVDFSNILWLSFVFTWLFVVILWSAFAVVRHAEALAIRLGEPYGTLILTLSVISIEIMMISAVMITGGDKPTLARDTMYSILMIVLNGMIGLTLLLGALRYREQQYNLRGANSFLAVILPLAILGLILPNYTRATMAPTFSTVQSIFLVTMTLGIYAVFLMMQTVRHRTHFMEPEEPPMGNALAKMVDHEHVTTYSVLYHSVLLLCYLAPVVLLAKKLAIPIDHGIGVLGAPAAVGGFFVAVLVLSPEGLGAIHAALQNQLQRAVNIFLGSGLATISLTIPAVLVIGLGTGEQVVLGLDHEESVMLVATLMLSIITFGSGRTNVLLGAVHLLLFCAYFMLIWD